MKLIASGGAKMAIQFQLEKYLFSTTHLVISAATVNATTVVPAIRNKGFNPVSWPTGLCALPKASEMAQGNINAERWPHLNRVLERGTVAFPLKLTNFLHQVCS